MRGMLSYENVEELKSAGLAAGYAGFAALADLADGGSLADYVDALDAATLEMSTEAKASVFAAAFPDKEARSKPLMGACRDVIPSTIFRETLAWCDAFSKQVVLYDERGFVHRFSVDGDARTAGPALLVQHGVVRIRGQVRVHRDAQGVCTAVRYSCCAEA